MGKAMAFIERHAGLRMHMHLFRHLAAKLFLDENTGTRIGFRHRFHARVWNLNSAVRPVGPKRCDVDGWVPSHDEVCDDLTGQRAQRHPAMAVTECQDDSRVVGQASNDRKRIRR